MKIKSYIILTTLPLALGLSSCKNYLDEDNKAGMTGELTYSTKAGIDGLIASCYSFSRGWYGKEPSLGLSEMGTDLFYYGYDNKQKSLNSYSITSVSLDDDVSDNACLDQYWEMFYSAVDACNNALKYVPLNTVISTAKKQQYLGEAYFLRAFYYWHMVNIWGPIPYNTEPPVAINTNPIRVPEEVVYSNMLDDLDKSIAYFDTANYRIKTEGRANYWSGRALKARVLLYAASWLGRTSLSTNTNYASKDLYALAQAEADAVMNSGTASFYTNYSDTWSMNNEDITKNKEAIWGVTYSSDLLTPVNCIPYRYRTDDKGNLRQYNSLITRTGYTRGGSAMLLMFVSKWDNGCKDLGGTGKQIFMRAISTTTDTIRNTKTNVLVHVAPYYSPYGRGFTRYLPSLYLWNLLDKHRATDQRTNATLLEAYTIAPGLEGNAKNYPLIQDTAIYYCPLDGSSPEGMAKQAWAKNRYRIQFKANGDIPIYTTNDPATALPTSTAKAKSDVYADTRYNDINIGGWCSFPGIKKFLDNVFNPTYPTNDLSYRDAIVMRLAEMYLIKAECQLYTESGANAMATINQLRAVRAIPGQDNSLSGTADIETILQERAVELCGEQQRWFDLKRTKTLVAHVKAYNAQASKNIQDYHLLRPIPQTQMDAVTNESTDQSGFYQNPGY
ncbi:MAG TPA: RagB/SusD family nutrient uptake outer membrane protein [Bacteroidales bacterium]